MSSPFRHHRPLLRLSLQDLPPSPARIDQRFFREAYSTEHLLAELSDEARNFTEVEPLLTTITHRIGDTLHIDRIAVFLRSGDTYRLQLAIGAPVSVNSFSLSATSTTIANLNRGRAPANVYRDDPSSWLVDASEAERSALADLSTELLVPLPGRNSLAGVMALGPKRSEEPYSRTDRQLLQSIASQTGLALENAELLQNLTAEIADRERVSKEIEIAREVQQRLFPRSTPKSPASTLWLLPPRPGCWRRLLRLLCPPRPSGRRGTPRPRPRRHLRQRHLRRSSDGQPPRQPTLRGTSATR